MCKAQGLMVKEAYDNDCIRDDDIKGDDDVWMD
jgi:hypothetical protein